MMMGESSRMEISRTPSSAELFFGGFEEAIAVIEACYSWRPTYERLEEVGLEVKLAHPSKVRAIAEAKVKTDSIDAKILAHLLRSDLIPESHVPPREVRELQDKVRLRAELGGERTRIKNKIRAELEKNRITCWCNPFTIGGRKGLGELGIYSVEHYLAVLETIEERIKMIDKDFKKIAGESEEAKILMTIPGIGPFSALLILAEIGETSIGSPILRSFALTQD